MHSIESTDRINKKFMFKLKTVYCIVQCMSDESCDIWYGFRYLWASLKKKSLESTAVYFVMTFLIETKLFQIKIQKKELKVKKKHDVGFQCSDICYMLNDPNKSLSFKCNFINESFSQSEKLKLRGFTENAPILWANLKTQIYIKCSHTKFSSKFNWLLSFYRVRVYKARPNLNTILEVFKNLV